METKLEQLKGECLSISIEEVGKGAYRGSAKNV